MNVRLWMSTAQAAEYADKNPQTIRKALEAGSLHGGQASTKGHWRIHVHCLDAWLLGETCQHQQRRSA